MQDIEPCKEDFITCKGLFCGSCNRLVHTHCALLSKHLNLTRFPSTGMGGGFDSTLVLLRPVVNIFEVYLDLFLIYAH